METSAATALAALLVALASAAVSIPLAIRADRRAGRAEARAIADEQAKDVVWRLEPDPDGDAVVWLRNVGRKVARDVKSADSLFGYAAVRKLFDAMFVGPNETESMWLATREDITRLPSTLRVSWKSDWRDGGREQEFEASVSTDEVRLAVREQLRVEQERRRQQDSPD